MDGGKKVWIRDDESGFKLSKICDIGGDSLTVETLDSPKKVLTLSYDSAFPCDDNELRDVDDNCALMYLNEANLLNNTRLRFKKDIIYTYVANVLIAVNPYKEVKFLYSIDTIKKYQGKSLGTLQPHVYAIADKSYRDMRAYKQSQSIIVSGESGAGKTESTKYILKYLTESYGLKSGLIESRINESNPLLEAFGNAKTTRNNNSSRFGKFIELHFNEQFKVAGGYISHYLLEKSRICVQSDEERNYHIFYRLCAGANDKLKSLLFIGKPQDYHYLNRGCTKYFDSSNKESLRDTNLDDKKDFLVCDKALEQIGLSEDDKLNIYKTVASVLHIGNLDFEDDQAKGGCRLTTKGKQALRICSSMLGLDEDELQKGLTTRIMQANKGGKLGTVIMIPLKVSEAQNARDALAKAIYTKLFDCIVACVNKAIPFAKSFTYIGILDTAGFEFFKVNSFEQFCINYCNEKLQQFFNERIFKEEQQIYEKECLGIKRIEYVDNQDCIELFEQKLSGLFDLLNEESKLPQPRAENFTSQALNKNKNHTRIDFPRKSKLKSDRELRDEEGFLIRHFAGPVVYTTSQFIEKNNDALHSSLACLVQECKNNFIKNLFDYSKIDSKQNIGKLNFESVSGKFRTQLHDLMEKLKSTGTSFIRCIKPNAKMISNEFSSLQVLTQLQSSGMTHVLELMQKGFPSRTSFNDLYETYKKNLPISLLKLETRIFCKALFKVLNLKEDDYKFGLTKVFFRPGKFAEFDQILKTDQENISSLVDKLKRWLVRTKWKKFIWCAYSVIKCKNKLIYRHQAVVNIQKNVRMYLIKSKYNRRIKHLGKLRSIEGSVRVFEEKLPKNDALLVKLSEFKKKINEKIAQIKKLNSAIDNDLISSLETQFEKLKQDHELSKKQEVENAKLKKAAEEERLRVEHAKKQAELTKEKTQPVNKQSSIDAKQSMQKPFDENLKELTINNKDYDLTKWKYADLRDAINTSCDVKLLDACREEFHRRLKVYHAWKTKNKNTNDDLFAQNEEPLKNFSPVINTTPTTSDKQRYFRIPFARHENNASNTAQKNGFWFAHFDGKWIARQIEIYKDKPATLLIAGKDDINMCELSLDETGLTHKKDAEINEKEFDRVWNENSGREYLKQNRESISSKYLRDMVKFL